MRSIRACFITAVVLALGIGVSLGAGSATAGDPDHPLVESRCAGTSEVVTLTISDSSQTTPGRPRPRPVVRLARPRALKRAEAEEISAPRRGAHAASARQWVPDRISSRSPIGLKDLDGGNFGDRTVNGT
jgi:hypothetical protein